RGLVDLPRRLRASRIRVRAVLAGVRFSIADPQRPSGFGREVLGRLTARPAFLISAGGTPLPTEGRLSGRIGHDDEALCAAIRAAFLLQPLCQAPRLEPASPHRRSPRTLPP